MNYMQYESVLKRKNDLITAILADAEYTGSVRSLLMFVTKFNSETRDTILGFPFAYLILTLTNKTNIHNIILQLMSNLYFCNLL
jgi:hypothetical protein